MARRVFPAGTVTNTTGAPLRLTFHVTSTTGRRETDLWTVDGSNNLVERIPNGVILTNSSGAYSAFAGPDDIDTLYLQPHTGAARTSILATARVASGVTEDNATYAEKGRRSLSVYDEFSRYPDGAMAGLVPTVGTTWIVSGAALPTITSGTANSTGTGYLGQILAAPIKSMSCEMYWSGTGTGQSMTLIASTDSSLTVANAVHCNFGPAGFTLTLRKDAGAFDSLLFGNWRQAMKVDGSTVYRVSMLLRGNTVIVHGPNGETWAATDPRVGLLAGTMGIWEPTTASGTACRLVSAAATSDATSGKVFPYLLGGDVAGGGMAIGPNMQAVGSRNTRSEASVGQDPTSNLPSLILGPLGPILGVLQTAASIGDTSVSTDIYIPNGSTVQFESGNGSESLTASANSTGTGPYATTIPALTKVHAAGSAVIVTVPASYVAKFTSNAGTVTAPASMIFTDIYSTGQTARLTQGASGVWNMSSSVGTGKGALITGKTTTAARPSAATVTKGAQMYDTDLNIPIWSDGTNWKNAAGTIV